MKIDWFTIGAQAMNFLILVWLMKRFLYKPILTAIDVRENLIEKQVADANDKVADADKERTEFEGKNVEFDKERSALLLKATGEVKLERQRLLNDARQAAADFSAKRQETLQSEADNLNKAIMERTQEEVFAITRKVLADLATTSLEERLGEVFTRRLRDLDDPAKQLLGQSIKSGSEPAVVRSAFELPDDQRDVIKNALNETFSADVAIRFETAPKLIGGIELTAGGQKVAWSISEYLLSLQKGVDDLIKTREKPEEKPVAKADEKPVEKPDVTADSVTASETPSQSGTASGEVKTQNDQNKLDGKKASNGDLKAHDAEVQPKNGETRNGGHGGHDGTSASPEDVRADVVGAKNGETKIAGQAGTHGKSASSEDIMANAAGAKNGETKDGGTVDRHIKATKTDDADARPKNGVAAPVVEQKQTASHIGTSS